MGSLCSLFPKRAKKLIRCVTKQDSDLLPRFGTSSDPCEIEGVRSCDIVAPQEQHHGGSEEAKPRPHRCRGAKVDDGNVGSIM